MFYASFAFGNPDCIQVKSVRLLLHFECVAIVQISFQGSTNVTNQSMLHVATFDTFSWLMCMMLDKQFETYNNVQTALEL